MRFMCLAHWTCFLLLVSKEQGEEKGIGTKYAACVRLVFPYCLGMLSLSFHLIDLVLVLWFVISLCTNSWFDYFHGLHVFVHLHSLILVSWVSEVSWVSDSVYLEVLFYSLLFVILKHLGTECKEQKSHFTDISTRTANKQVICT